jgi:uncharacterized protein (DUF486 family)
MSDFAGTGSVSNRDSVSELARAAGGALPQLKILQGILTLAVFVPVAVFYIRTPLKLDYLWAALCMVAAAWFMFRGTVASPG